jgi:multidrug resistance efflux pump
MKVSFLILAMALSFDAYAQRQLFSTRMQKENQNGFLTFFQFNHEQLTIDYKHMRELVKLGMNSYEQLRALEQSLKRAQLDLKRVQVSVSSIENSIVILNDRFLSTCRPNSITASTFIENAKRYYQNWESEIENDEISLELAKEDLGVAIDNLEIQKLNYEKGSISRRRLRQIEGRVISQKASYRARAQAQEIKLEYIQLMKDMIAESI